eukprot:NODE_13131_length_1183_cov_5.245265.p2 GENE.NODE_13131_length_1183_cov_5.245265~~NODE_13131_length_1183_cov_5.245265.p2  ORF type:complete len:214 (+),score=53.02 NODE_13131_length_1183_cov_5.245265:362-1003(+)
MGNGGLHARCTHVIVLLRRNLVRRGLRSAGILSIRCRSSGGSRHCCGVRMRRAARGGRRLVVEAAVHRAVEVVQRVGIEGRWALDSSAPPRLRRRRLRNFLAIGAWPLAALALTLFALALAFGRLLRLVGSAAIWSAVTDWLTPEGSQQHRAEAEGAAKPLTVWRLQDIVLPSRARERAQRLAGARAIGEHGAALQRAEAVEAALDALGEFAR